MGLPVEWCDPDISLESTPKCPNLQAFSLRSVSHENNFLVSYLGYWVEVWLPEIWEPIRRKGLVESYHQCANLKHLFPPASLPSLWLYLTSFSAEVFWFTFCRAYFTNSLQRLERRGHNGWAGRWKGSRWLHCFFLFLVELSTSTFVLSRFCRGKCLASCWLPAPAPTLPPPHPCTLIHPTPPQTFGCQICLVFEVIYYSPTQAPFFQSSLRSSLFFSLFLLVYASLFLCFLGRLSCRYVRGNL